MSCITVLIMLVGFRVGEFCLQYYILYNLSTWGLRDIFIFFLLSKNPGLQVTHHPLVDTPMNMGMGMFLHYFVKHKSRVLWKF